MNYKFRNVTVSIVVIVMAFTGHVFASSFADTHGFSTKGIGMGNAMTAIVDDWSSVYYNMAGLGKTQQLKGNAVGGSADTNAGMGLKKKDAKKETNIVSGDTKPCLNELHLGFMYTMPMFKIDYNRSASDLDILGDKDLEYGIITLGVALDLNTIITMPSFFSSARLGIGMGTPADGNVARVNDDDLRTHDFIRYGREAQMAKIMVGLGFGFMDDLFGVGLGVNASFAGKGTMIMENVQVSSGDQTPTARTQMDLGLNPSILAGVYFSPGRLIPVLKGLETGISYRQETAMEIKPFDAAAIIDDVTSMEMKLAIFDYYSPHSFTLGVAYDVLGMVLVSVDVEMQLWSLYKVSPVMEKIYNDLDETNPSGGYEIPDAKNIIIPKLGVKYDVFDWFSVMAGAAYRPSIFDASALDGRLNMLDGATIMASLGAGFKVPPMFGLKGPIDIFIAYQYQYMLKTTTDKTDIDPYGPDADDTNDNMNPNYSFGGMCHAVTVGLTYHL